MKAKSSRWVRTTFPQHRDFAWQKGYGIFTVSRTEAKKVRRYIADQQIHHRAIAFLDEFRSLLKANGLRANEEDGWD